MPEGSGVVVGVDEEGRAFDDAVHRATSGDIEDAPALRFIQRAVQGDLLTDFVYEGRVATVARIVLAAATLDVKGDFHAFQRPALALGVQPKRGGGSGPQRGEEQAVRVRRRAVAGWRRLVRGEAAVSRLDGVLRHAL